MNRHPETAATGRTSPEPATARPTGERSPARAALVILAVTALVGASCTYGVTVRAAPSRAAYAFDEPLPARVAVFTDGDQLWRDVQIFAEEGGFCADSNYPVDARDALEGSVVGTLQPLVREVEATPVQIRRDDMVARNFDLVVAVRAEVFDPAIAATGFSGLEATVALGLAVSVFTEDGLLFRESVAGNAVQSSSGVGCDQGAVNLGNAAEIALENAMTELGELIANAPALRDAFRSGSGS